MVESQQQTTTHYEGNTHTQRVIPKAKKEESSGAHIINFILMGVED